MDGFETLARAELALDRPRAYLAYWRRRWYLHGWHPWRVWQRRSALRRAEHYFAQFPELTARWRESTSTGAERTDYHLLHAYIRQRRPVRVLEHGCGVTTLVMAHALYLNGAGVLDSVEDQIGWARETATLLRPEWRPFVRLHVARRSVVWGAVSYDPHPEGRWDLAFIDGPTEYLPDGTKGYCGSIVPLVQQKRVRDVIIDRKFTTQDAIARAGFRVRYDPVSDVGVVTPDGLHGPQPIDGQGRAWRDLGLTP